MRPRGGRSAILAGAVWLAGCEHGATGVDLATCHVAPPAVLASAVTENPYNVLSAVVAARLQRTDSVSVRFGPAGASLDSATATVVSSGDSALVPVLGLMPETKYRLRVVAYGRCDTAAGSEMTFTTGQLPADLPRYVASGSDSSGGFVVMAAGQFGLVIDNTGRVVWYRRFASGPGLNFQAQPVFGGRYVARPPTATTQQGVVVELDPLGAETRRITCAEALQPRFHDMIAQADGSYWLLCDQTETMNLANIGGNEAAQVTGTAIQHVSAKGDLLFSWSPFGSFSILDLDASDRNGSTVNWTHGNAFDIDTDGNLIVSFRSLNEITKIDSRTGEVLWRMGGKANEFTFDGGTSPPFARQHGVRVVGHGEIVLLDNLGVPGESRAERYVYDEAQRWARLEASYSSQPAIVAQLGGTTQDLPGGRTLVAFGNGGRVEEYDAAGNVVWRIEGNPGYIYRAQRIRSLYSPGVGSRR